MTELNTIIEQKKRFSIWRFFKRLFFSILISIVAIFSISALLIFVYEDDVKAIMIKELNKHLNSEVRIDPKNIDLTIINSFPNCALEFKDLVAMEAIKAKQKDTLLYAKRLALAFNIKDLFNEHYSITKIELENAKAYLKVDSYGNPNYLVWKTDTTTKTNDSLSFALEKIALKNISFSYKNSKQKIKLETEIKKLNFKGTFNDDQYLLKTDGNAYVEVFKVEKINYLYKKNLKFNIELDVNGNTYTVKKSETFINSTQIVSSGKFIINDSLELLDIAFKGKNLDISTTLSLLPEKFQAQINDYKSDGEFYATGNAYYNNKKPFSLNAEFGIKQGVITYKPQNTTLQNVNLKGSIVINETTSVLKLNNITANLNNNSFNGSVEVSNFKDPYLKLKTTAKTNLKELVAFYPIDTIQEISGNINANIEIEGLISEMKSNAYSPNIKASGEITLMDLKAKLKQSEKEINVPEGKLVLNERHLNIFGLKILKGKSDVLLVGSIPNFLGYMFDSKAPLIINASVTSDMIELEDFLFPSTNTQTKSDATVSIPSNLEFNLEATVTNFSFGKFTAKDVKGAVLLKDQKAAVKDLSLNTTDGIIKMNAFADASDNSIKVSGTCELVKLNIQKLFIELNNFGQNTLTNKHLKGFITAHVDFTANWDKQLNIDLNSINASTNILIERGELIGFTPLESLAKYIDVTELRHIKFSTLQSNIDIKNKTITIPKTSIKSNAINLELWGKHTFDNQIDYHIQLLISELLAKRTRNNKQFDEELSLVENDPENRRSVFIVMTGPIDNPTIKYDKKGAKEKIKEDIKQEKQNLKQLLKEEFGFFKKDSLTIKESQKSEQKFQIQIGEDNPKKTTKPLQPKRKDEDEDF